MRLGEIGVMFMFVEQQEGRLDLSGQRSQVVACNAECKHHFWAVFLGFVIAMQVSRPFGHVKSRMFNGNGLMKAQREEE